MKLLLPDRSNKRKMSVEDITTLTVTLVGLGFLIGGAVILGNSVNGTWMTINGIGSNVTGLIVGGFLCIIGVLVVCAGLGVLGEAANAISDIWDTFVSAIGRG